MQETRVQFLGQEDPLEKEMATHSIILVWDSFHYNSYVKLFFSFFNMRII